MARDWIVIAICLIILMIWGFLKLQENKLENEVYDVIEEKVQDETFTIESIDEVNYKEKEYIFVSYIIKGDPTEYLGMYYQKNGEWILDETKEIGNEND